MHFLIGRRARWAALIAALGSFALSSSASADPGGPNLQPQATFACDDGSSVLLNPGTATNRGRLAWVVNSTSVYVTSYFAVYQGPDPVFVFYDSKPGLKSPQLRCTADAGDGFTFVAIGFFTSR